MKQVRLLAAFLLLAAFAKAQDPVDTSWKAGGFIGINFNQVNLSQWAPGGENSLALASSFNLFANYVKGKNEWNNSLDLAYAVLKSGSEDLRKSDDRIELNSKYSHKLSDHWLYSGLVNFKSQFTSGYKYPDDSTVISKFMSPGYLTVSAGFTYKPVDYFEVMISPATGKFTFVTDQTLSDLGAYGVDSGKTIRSEFGAYLNLLFKKDIMENVTLKTKLELFKNYSAKSDDNASKIDVNWDASLEMKINSYLSASVSTQLVYDADVIERTQFKEVLAIGFGMKF